MRRTIKRRRREAKTDYLARLKLLKGQRPRLVFRKTNKYVIAQYTTSIAAQDSVVKGITSKDLLKYGWPKEMTGSLKSIPASYLTGYLIGSKILKEKMETPIVDLGMIKTLYKTKIFAFINGLIDAGLEISCKEEAFPEEERIKGSSMKEDFTKTFEVIKSNINKE